MGEWNSYNNWVVLIGFLSAAACALPGCFLVLRRASLLGDAVSHAVLPGIAIAFLVTGSRASWPMFLGAAAVGVLTALASEWVQRFGKVDTQAALGIVFTTLFAAGLILIRQASDHVDLDPTCVLYGSIDTAPQGRSIVFGGTEIIVNGQTINRDGFHVPLAVLTNGGMLLLNLVLILVIYKELKVSSFDPAFADSVGVPSRWVHYGLMAVVAMTLVAAFESVGSILVIAMLVVPGAAALLLTRRLWVALVLSVVFAGFTAGLGHVAALTVPRAFGLEDTVTAGAMATVSGVLFVAVMVFAPRDGWVAKAWHAGSLAVRIVADDKLARLYRLDERPEQPLPRIPAKPWTRWVALRVLMRQGMLQPIPGGHGLTPPGRARAQGLVRSHRLWESYLAQETATVGEHVHLAAEQLEHATGEDLQRRLAEVTQRPKADPHGRPIPEPGDAEETT